MFHKSIACLLAVLTLLGCAGTAVAAEVDCDSVYCFQNTDFEGEEPLSGICITGLPDPKTGTLMLGVRVLRCGDILTADQLTQVTFCPLQTREDTQAVLTYLPVFSDRVAPVSQLSITVRGREDKAPVAEDNTLETYKNLPNEGKLKVTAPEGQPMTFTLLRQPRRGTVELRGDGSFVYTPKKNKVGVDSFTYTAADPNGNVSREATVTVQILKPADGARYTDTVGLDCRFAAEWLRNTGLFVAEQTADNPCFQPDKAVTKGEFLTMLVRLLEIPAQEQAVYTGLAEEAPRWLQPYLAAAVRSGLMMGWPDGEHFRANDAINGAEAAVLLQNALDLPVDIQTAQTVLATEEEAEEPSWADTALAVMNTNGFTLSQEATLTRAEAAQLLYRLSTLADTAPGLAVIRMQQ